MPLSTCNQKEFLIESKLNGFFGSFVVTLGLRNFHMGGEVKRTFLLRIYMRVTMYYFKIILGGDYITVLLSIPVEFTQGFVLLIVLQCVKPKLLCHDRHSLNHYWTEASDSNGHVG